jgi:CBS domain-containing protein
MNVDSLCHRDPVTICPSDEVLAAAQLMREKHVGCLVVIERNTTLERRRPVGVLTDRDIVVAVVACQADPGSLRVEDIMTRNPVTVSATDSVEAAVRKMRRIGVRRLPVTDPEGELLGVMSLDDVLDVLAGELQNIAGAIQHEQAAERQARP